MSVTRLSTGGASLGSNPPVQIILREWSAPLQLFQVHSHMHVHIVKTGLGTLV